MRTEQVHVPPISFKDSISSSGVTSTFACLLSNLSSLRFVSVPYVYLMSMFNVCHSGRQNVVRTPQQESELRTAPIMELLYAETSHPHS